MSRPPAAAASRVAVSASGRRRRRTSLSLSLSVCQIRRTTVVCSAVRIVSCVLTAAHGLVVVGGRGGKAATVVAGSRSCGPPPPHWHHRSAFLESRIVKPLFPLFLFFAAAEFFVCAPPFRPRPLPSLANASSHQPALGKQWRKVGSLSMRVRVLVQNNGAHGMMMLVRCSSRQQDSSNTGYQVYIACRRLSDAHISSISHKWTSAAHSSSITRMLTIDAHISTSTRVHHHPTHASS